MSDRIIPKKYGSDLFATRDTIEEAISYIDKVVCAQNAADRLLMLTAAQQLINTVIKLEDDRENEDRAKEERPGDGQSVSE